jgi:hypothetical protein
MIIRARRSPRVGSRISCPIERGLAFASAWTDGQLRKRRLRN